MKIINFISGKDLGGPKQSYILYSEVLIKLGHEVNSVIRHGAPIKEIMQSAGIQVREVKYIRSDHPLLIKKSVQKLRDTFKTMHASVIFVHKQLDVKLVRSALGHSAKIIGVIHGYNSMHSEHADELIAVSDKVKCFLIDEGCKQPIHVVPNMIKITSGQLYRDLPEIPLIGAMGIFRRKKGFHTLIKALSILKQKNIPFRAIIAGKGRITWYLNYLRWRLKLTEDLTIRGWVSNNERDEFIDRIDLFVLPSRSESFGMVVIEAMSRMKRIISTKCGGPEEIISDCVDGFLVENENPQAIANKLEELINDPVLSQNVPSAARNKACNKYSIDSVMNTVSSILEEDA